MRLLTANEVANILRVSTARVYDAAMKPGVTINQLKDIAEGVAIEEGN
jgi:hypothetical protein